MKKKISLLAVALLAIGLTACGNSGGQAAGSSTQTVQAQSAERSETSASASQSTGGSEASTGTSQGTEKSEPSSSQAAAASSGSSGVSVKDTSSAAADSTTKDNGVLVVYFSATGTTKGVAEKIAAVTGADTYEIKAAQEYSDADLNWNDQNSRSTKEQNDKSVRPKIGSDAISLDGYKTIYIGYPIWWGEEPRIMDTFVESHNFDGKTMIPFCTSGGSGIGRSGQNLAANAKSGTWLDGQRFSGGVFEDNIRSWIEGLK